MAWEKGERGEERGERRTNPAVRIEQSSIRTAPLQFLGGGIGEPFFATVPNFGFRPKSLSVIGSKSSE
jgi:hypothetical protein